MSSTLSTRRIRLAGRGRRRRALAGIALSAGLLFVAGCGSDDDSSDGDTAAAAEEDGAPADDAAADDVAADDAPADEPADPGPEEGGSYCGLLEDMGTDMLNGAAAADADAAAELVGTFREISESAPDDIAADWVAMADAMELLSDIDYSDPDALAQLEELEDLAAVSQRIQDNVQSECA